MTDLRSAPRDTLPMLLAGTHRRCAPGDLVRVWLPGPEELTRGLLDDLLTGAGFSIKRRESTRPTVLKRVWTLPDTIGPRMRLLISGLNPSPAAADAGVGFARPGNRFWPAALAASLVSRDRDPDHALTEHRVGMTDMVKRTTRRADELSRQEYGAGVERLERLVTWLNPKAVCFVGLAGWRSALDAKASAGWQERSLGGRPVYLMPSTSGLNATSQLPDLTTHIKRARAGAPSSRC